MSYCVDRWLTILGNVSNSMSNSVDNLTLAKETMANICGYFEGVIPDDIADMSYAALFNEENGILKFIQKVSTLKRTFDCAILPGFVLIRNLIELKRNKILKHSCQIKDFCWRFWVVAEAASQKEKALEVLISLFEYIPQNDDNSQVNFMVDKLMSEISETSKPKATVLQKLYHLLGVLAKQYPEKVHDISDKIFLIFINRLDQQIIECKAGSFTVITGRLDGISEYLCSFPRNPIEHQLHCDMLNKVVKLMIAKEKETRRTASRAALNLLGKHGSQISKHLIEEYKWWHEKLWNWVSSDNSDDLKVGQASLDTFYQVISEELLKMDPNKAEPILQEFICKIKGKMMHSIKYYDQQLVIKGFGYLSTACNALISSEEVSKLFTDLVQHTERLYFRSSDIFPQSILLLPVYLEAMGRMIGNLNDVTVDQIAILQKLSVLLIENIPAFPPMQDFQCPMAIVMVSYYLSIKGISVEMYLEKVLFQGLIRSCSHPVSIDAVFLEEKCQSLRHNSIGLTTYKSYLTFWEGLFKVRKSQLGMAKGSSVIAYKCILELIFAHFLKAILTIIDKLDLKVIKGDIHEKSVTEYHYYIENGHMSGDGFRLQASNSKDFQIFINLVDLSCKILSAVEPSMVDKELNHFMMRIIYHSESKPLISGFYKILATCLCCCCLLKYFEDAGSLECLSSEKNESFKKLSQFLQKVLIQVKQYKGDLQVSCLKLFLALPVSLIKPLLGLMAPLMQAVFKVGYSYIPLAIMGIESLEKWTLELSWMDWSPILRQILPSLDPFLKSGGSKINFHAHVGSSKPSKAINSRKKYLVAKRKLESRSHSEIAKGSPLHQLQRRMLIFIAHLPPSTALTLIGGERDIQLKLAIAWDSKLHLPFYIPLPDMKPCIYIDKFLPRVVELALTSSDRKARIPACELLHAFFMYLLGTGVQLSAVKPGQLSKLVQRLIPTLIELGCDSDIMVKQLFYPLLLRLSHWYSNKWHLKSQESSIWIEALLDGLCHPRDAAVRELSAICLKEFVVWSMRQLESKERDSSSVNVKAILKKICGFSLHSCPYKRIGASLAVNHLYPILSEEESVVDQFWLELLYHQVLGLEHCESLSSKCVMTASLQHLESAMKVKADIFNRHSKTRRKPPDFAGVLLKDAVYWLLKQCGSLSVTSRKECMKLVMNLATHVKGCHSPKDFINNVIENDGIEDIIIVCEGVNGLPDMPSWISTEYFSMDNCSRGDLILFLNWMNFLLAALDCYIWLFVNNLAQPSQVFTKNGKFKIFDAISGFISALHIFDKNIIKTILETSVVSSFALQGDKCITQNAKIGEVCIQIFQFLTILLEKSSSDSHLEQLLGNIWSLKMWKLTSEFIFNESFRESNTNGLENHLVIKGLMEAIRSNLSAEIYNSLLNVVGNNFQQLSKSLLEDLPNAISSGTSFMYLGIVKNLFFVHESSVFTGKTKDIYFHELKESNVLQHIFNALFINDHSKVVCVVLSQTSLLYVESLLRLCYTMNIQMKNITSLVLDETEAEIPYSQKKMTKGEYFYLSFKSSIVTFLTTNLKSCIKCLLEQLIQDGRQPAINITLNILKDLVSDVKDAKRCAEESVMASCLSHYWPSLLLWSQNNCNKIMGLLELLIILSWGYSDTKELLVFEDVSHWLISLLANQKHSFEIKIKVLKLLPCFVGQKEENNNNLRIALKAVFDQYFAPHVPSLSKIGGIKRPEAEIILQRVLIAIEITCSPVFLRFFIIASNGGSTYTSENELEKSLVAMMKRADAEKQLEAISTVHSIALDGDYDPAVRFGSAKIFASKLIETAKQDAVVKFFVTNIRKILQTLQENLEAQPLWKLKHQLISKIIHFQLIGTMFLKFGKELESPSCPISFAYNNGKPNERQLIKELTRRAWEARKTLGSEVEETKELLRQYRCAAYNATVAAVANLKNEERFYSLLFQEKPCKGDRIWDGLVDTTEIMVLSSSCDEYQGELILSIPINEGELTRKRKIEESNSDSSCNYSFSLGVKEYLSDSTLHDDVSKFDFSDCSVKSLCWALEEGKESTQDKLTAKHFSKSRSVTYSCDAINNHECMAMICGLIEHMVEEKITPLPEGDKVPSDVPLWVKCIKEVIENRERHSNVKIFLIKVILNSQKHFTPYANNLLMPVMELVASADLGASFNYIISDVVMMLLLWTDLIKNMPENAISGINASQIFKFFILNSGDLSNDIFKHYLQLIRSMFEAWNKFIEIPYDIILDKTKMSSKDSKSIQIGLMLASILLENSINPWKTGDKERFLNHLLEILEKSSNDICTESASVVGMVLRLMDPDEEGFNQKDLYFFDSVVQILRYHSENQKDTFLLCLNKMHMFYAKIVDKFISTVLFQLPQRNGKFKTICLKIVISRVEIIEKPYIELRDKGLLHWLDTRVPEDQEIALNMIKKCLSKLSEDELKEILNHICSFFSHQNVECRRIMYEILMWIFENYCHNHWNKNNEESDALWTYKCKETLILGLEDENPVIQNQLCSFWEGKEGLKPNDPTLDRLVTIIERLYSPTTESSFLAFALSLLLSPSATTTQYKEKLFAHGLAECQFQEYPLIQSWRSQHIQLIPMFADTVENQFSQLDLNPQQLSDATTMYMQPRVTQESATFLPTEGSSGGFWSSIQQPRFTIGKSYGMDARSSVFSKASNAYQHYTLEGNSERVFKQPSAWRMQRKQFRRYEPKDRAYFAIREMRKETQRREMEFQRREQRESEILPFRQYRIGDFPDIQVDCSDILLPLLAVAKRDPVISQKLFVSVFNGILDAAESLPSYSSSLGQECSRAFNKILKETTLYTGALIGSVLEISLGHSNFIQLNNEAVVSVAEPSGLSSLACLYLEDKLNHWLPEQPRRSLYDRNQASRDKGTWLQLAKIYQSIEEYDIVHGIFHDVMGSGSDVKKALESERAGQWAKAMTSFQEILNQPLSENVEDQERDYYYEGYFKCLANLSCWEQLNREVVKQLSGSFMKIWEDSWLSEKLLPWLLLSQVRIGLESESKMEELFNSLCAWLKDKEKRDYLKTHFSGELAWFYFMSGRLDSAKYHVGQRFDLFLQEWSHLNPLSTKIRTSRLLDIQILGEFSMFLSTNMDRTQKCFTDQEKLCSNWAFNLPSPLDSLRHWEQRVAFRNLYLKSMRSVADEKQISVNLQNVSATMTLSMVETAISLHNFQVAKKYLMSSESLLKKHQDPTLRIAWQILYGYLPWIHSKDRRDISYMNLSSSLKAWELLEDLLHDSELSFTPHLHIDIYKKIFTVLSAVTGLVKENPSTLESIDDHTKEKFLQSIQTSSCSSSVTEKISAYCVNCLKEAVAIAEILPGKISVSDMYLSMAKYCRSLMKESAGMYDEICMEALLKAMANGSDEARQRFPCLLQFNFSHSPLSELFITKTREIPTWMFLGWTSQILAHLNGPTCAFLAEIIRRLAETYPAAIVFPFRLSCEKYGRNNSETLYNVIEVIKKIVSKNTIIEAMLESLTYVCQPDVMFSYHLDRIVSLLDVPNPDINDIHEAHGLMMREVFLSGGVKSTIGYQHYGSLISILQSYKDRVMKALRPDLAFLGNLNALNSVKRELLDIKQSIGRTKSSVLLKDYSHWLANFRSSGYRDSIEIPGQYTGECEPQSEKHTRIVGFLPNVTVMSSQRKPICITIFGSDGKEHKYLVKYGEDLRLDQRIEQIFGLMNKSLAEDSFGKERDLKISIYQVIPLTTCLGMIEWVDGTLSLSDMISLSMNKNESRQRKATFGLYNSWLNKALKRTNNNVDLYRYAFLYYGRDETIQAYKELVNSFPCDMLRRSLLALSQSFEGFWSLRYAFTTSYASICIAHWLLGIGDRHTCNTLVSAVTGRVIGIDFGYSFGSSTQFLAVPELMPFRLTPQIIGLNQPFGEMGLMREAMAHTMRILQKKHDILLSTMDVFVKEPSVDWLENARKQAKADGMSDLAESHMWYPKQKILIMQRKFIGGTNPVEITLEELGSRHNDNSNVLKKMKEVAKGHPDHNIRASLCEKGLSCEQQVSCLIDQATDYHILGKTWSGWEPWL